MLSKVLHTHCLVLLEACLLFSVKENDHNVTLQNVFCMLVILLY